MNKKIPIIALVIMVALGGSYLVLHKRQSTNTSSSPSTSTSVTPAGKLAPDFTLKTLDGQQFSLAAHKGKPVILLGVFGGCGECIPIGKTLAQIQADFAAQGVSVIAVDILKGEPASVLEQYGKTIKANFPLADYNADVVNAYKLDAPEISYVIDKNGNIANMNRKTLSYEEFKKQVEKAL